MFRFAPSPTGDMHIGNLRAALINYICACQSKKGFILRIEDTDTARNIPGKDEEIQLILKKFGINWDAFYTQSKNFAHHRQLAAHLLKTNAAFACVCTPEMLEREREEAAAQKRAYRYSGKCECNCAGGADGAGEKIELLCQQLLQAKPLSWDGAPCTIRLKKPSKNISFCDEIKGELSFAPADVDSFVIMRADCSPVYNFACCCDDICEGVSMIIRGEDHVSNTPKQEHIRASIGVSEMMKYAHLPIILSNGSKMSKREQSSSVNYLLNLGILPSAVANYLLLLGNKTPKEIFSLDEAIEFFSLANISHSSANFDMHKLLFINREHMRALDDEALALAVFKDEFIAKMNHKIAELGALAKLYLEEASTLSELSAKLAGYFLPIRVSFKEKEEFLESAKKLAQIITKCPAYGDIKELSGLGGKQLFKPLRLLLSSAENGPELAKIYELCCPIMSELLALKFEQEL